MLMLRLVKINPAGSSIYSCLVGIRVSFTGFTVKVRLWNRGLNQLCAFCVQGS